MAYALARLVRTVVGVVVLIIVVGGVLFLLSANPSNAIVHDIHNAASTAGRSVQEPVLVQWSSQGDAGGQLGSGGDRLSDRRRASSRA